MTRTILLYDHVKYCLYLIILYNYVVLTKLNEKTERLQNKLESAEAEIENLLSENFYLQKIIAEKDKRIEHLTRICRSASHKTIKKKINNTTLNMTNS